MTVFPKPVILALAMSAAVVGAASAQSVRELGVFREWKSYATADGAGEVCFALSQPQTVSPQPDGFTAAWLYISHRPGESVTNEFNLVAGFTFAPDSAATVSVGGDSFVLFTKDDAAWLDDPSQGDRLSSTIRAGSSLVVEGTSDKGIKVTETFSLSGATAASKAIDSEC
ncbi:MAG: hypothetical protein JWR75_1612 [Devosia sp.]|nr:hypothetical protein [Devosia sp.]